MTEKDVQNLETTYRETKENIGTFAIITGIIAGVIVLMTVCFLIVPVAFGLVVYFGWNAAMPTMFHVNTISFLNAALLVATLSNMNTPMVRKLPVQIGDMFNSLSSKINEKDNKEKMIADVKAEFSKRVKTLGISILNTVISLLLTTVLFKYSWNTILPNLLGIDMAHISTGASLGFVLVYNVLFVSYNGSEKE